MSNYKYYQPNKKDLKDGQAIDESRVNVAEF